MEPLLRYIQDRKGEVRLQEPGRGSVITEFAVEGEKSIVRHLVDVEPIMKDCAFFRKLNEDSRGYSDRRNFRHIGRLPFHVDLHFTRAAMGDQRLFEKYIKRYLKGHPEFCTISPSTI